MKILCGYIFFLLATLPHADEAVRRRRWPWARAFHASVPILLLAPTAIGIFIKNNFHIGWRDGIFFGFIIVLITFIYALTGWERRNFLGRAIIEYSEWEVFRMRIIMGFVLMISFSPDLFYAAMQLAAY